MNMARWGKEANEMSNPNNTGATIVVRNGRPVILHDGVVVPRATYFDRIMWHKKAQWEERVRAFVNDGVTVFHLTTPRGNNDPYGCAFWTDEDVYPLENQPKDQDISFGNPLSLQGQVDYILSIQPGAKFYVDCGTMAPVAWTTKHPDHTQTDEDGHTHLAASLSSALYLEGLSRYLRHLVTYCEGQAWGPRIIGYKILPLGEGTMPLTDAGKFFDCSGENERVFRVWLKTQYPNVEALRQAWCEPGVTFEQARIPRDREWLAKRASANPSLNGQALDDKHPLHGKGLLHWTEPQNMRRELDYAAFQRMHFLTWLRTMTTAVKAQCADLKRSRLVGFDVTKQPLMGWEIMSAFNGQGDGQNFPNILFLSGSCDVGEFLDDPDLDFIWTPADYTARGMGFAYEAEGVTDSLVLRGKAMLIENDARCYVGQGSHEQGAFRNEQETEAGLLRNAAMILSRGLYDYWCNVTGDVKSYFSDPGIHRIIAKITPMLDRLDTAPHRETRDAIAMIIDDTSPVHEDLSSGYQYLSVVWQRVLELGRCGVPYRLYLLSDLKKDNFPAYKVYLFPNLFKVDDEVLALLRQKVLRDGNAAIFGPGTGITDGVRLHAEGASRLLGVPMELAPYSAARHVMVQDQGHPITCELPANLTYGDSQVYGPLLLPEEGAVEKAGAVALGLATACWSLNRTGLFIKEFGQGAGGNGRPDAKRGADDYAVVWSEAVPVPSTLLRSVARYAGCNIWCESDDVIYASDTLVAIHTAKAGPRTLLLPRACEVRDALTGDLVARDCRTIELTLRSPDTRIFQLK
jgi:hypothetical protein